ncbi:ATP-binding protein [Streptomyces spinoverrucosus]|uniref:ATP-binding protein n=1 Tax=Streptomyces spinoverrucosus TaxID=284043 RepID=A0A4Y3VF43_9ACTN|nr:ATP-binding protein [Streptomyces spinoverrucosus]GHB59082.1 ATP-binding protein [Streptomyces spinoverrucosus]
MTLRDIRLVNVEVELPYQRDQFYARHRRSVPAARHFTWWSLKYWGLGEWERAEDVSVCVSELATNALLHGVPPGRGFLLRVRYDGDVLRVEVHDSGSGVPRVADEADEGGRGLLLVAALSDKWGVGERELGKVVWCEFALPAGGA